MLNRLIIPALWLPDQSEEDWESSVWLALESSFALGDFINGRISAEEYCDSIADLGVDPLLLGEALDGN